MKSLRTRHLKFRELLARREAKWFVSVALSGTFGVIFVLPASAERERMAGISSPAGHLGMRASLKQLTRQNARQFEVDPSIVQNNRSRLYSNISPLRIDSNSRENRRALERTINLPDAIRINSSTQRPPSTRRLDLDLGSSTEVFSVTEDMIKAGSIEILTGNTIKPLKVGELVSAGEYIAARQAALPGGQQLNLDRRGRAIGGEVNFEVLLSDNDKLKVSSLVIPKDVTVHGDFSKHSEFRVLDEFINFGTVQTLSSEKTSSSGSIGADKITNQKDAIIKSTVDLTLQASTSLTNAGYISSDHDLSLIANGQINNSGTVSAKNLLTVDAPLIRNHGLLESSSSNITINAPSSSPLYVDNTGGTLKAVDGEIAVRTPDYLGSGYTQIIGGNLLSKAAKFHSGLGVMFVEVDELTGLVEETGSAVHVAASTEQLKIGSVCLDGDPTIFNSKGDILIVGDITVAEDLTVVASGNIISSPGITIIAGDASQGHDVTMIAGADFDVISGTDSPEVGPIPPSVPNTGQIELSGKASKTGGCLILGSILNYSHVITRSTNTAGNDPGGKVSLFAFDGPESGASGLQGTIFETGGRNGGANGDVIIVIDPPNFQHIDLGPIDTTGGTGGGGAVTVITASPVSSIKGEKVTYSSSGSRSSIAELVASNKLTKESDIVITQRPNTVEINAAGPINIFTDYRFGGAGMTSAVAINVEAQFNISSSTTMPFAAPIVTLFSDTFVGNNQPVLVDTPSISVAASFVNIENLSGGATTVVGNKRSGNFALKTSGDINVLGEIGNSKATVTLVTTGAGNINTTDTGTINATILTAITTGTGGIGTTAALKTNASEIEATSAIGINIEDSAKTIVLKNITANNGSIDIVTSTNTKTIVTQGLETRPALIDPAQIKATNGHIRIQNNNTKSGNIEIGQGTNIVTAGSGGDVSLLIGGTTNVEGPIPVGTVFTKNGTPIVPPLPANTFYFGTNGIATSKTASGAESILMNVLGGGRIIFNSGALSAKHITVVGNTTDDPTTITADPPLTAEPL